MDKRHYKEVFREFNFGHTITIHKGGVLYVGCIDGYKATHHYLTFDECLNDCRETLDNVPDWLNKLVNPKKEPVIKSK